MASKGWLFLSLVIVLLIAFEVAARDLAENSAENKNNVKEEQMPPGYGAPGYGDPGGNGGNPVGGHGGQGRGYCPYGCCYRGYYGGCSRCCAYAGEAVQTHPASTEPAH